MKICKGCEKELDDIKFHFLGFFRKSGKRALSSYCKPCDSLRVNPNRKKEYKSHSNKRQYKVIREDIIVDVKQIYLLIKKIEMNSLKIDMIDSFRLLSLYTDIFGDDISEYYTEKEQLDIIFFKLKDYMNSQTMAIMDHSNMETTQLS